MSAAALVDWFNGLLGEVIAYLLLGVVALTLLVLLAVFVFRRIKVDFGK